jgi:phosphoesterase RecJ-like protein
MGAALVAAGASPALVFERVYQNEPASRLRLAAAVLSTLELHHRSRLAVMTIPRRVFVETGASPMDTEDLVNYPMQITTVDVSVLLVEQEDGPTRVSFRSKAPSETRPDIDVATLAQRFAGGGHRRAAGARAAGSLDQVKQQIIQLVGSALPAN